MKSKWRILSLNPLADSPEAGDVLRAAGELVERPAEQSVLEGELPKCDACFASLRLRLQADLLERCPRLKVIATPTTGTGHIDVQAAEALGIRVLSLKDHRDFLRAITATAEHAWTLLLAANRRLPHVHQAACAGDWDREKFVSHQLSGATLGVLGYGRLGSLVAAYGTAFRMRVLVCDHKPVSPGAGLTAVDFDTLLRESDYLSLHIHATPENIRLFGAKEFARMKPGAVLVNTSPGTLLDEAALLEALRGGRLRAAGLDGVDGEWGDELANHPVLAYARENENLVLTPHIGGATVESRAKALAFMARKLVETLREQKGNN
ncbi:MAG: NAD(P)-dependent oxidoreductase [Verrucomicrobiota bacterium]